MFPIKTLVKFYKNPYPTSANTVISRTLLKISVIDAQWLAAHKEEQWPKEGEIWQANIVKEIEEGHAKGCFILEPIQKVTEITPLFPGFYTEETIEGKAILTPKQPDDTEINWMLPRAIKKTIKDQNLYAAIIKIK